MCSILLFNTKHKSVCDHFCVFPTERVALLSMFVYNDNVQMMVGLRRVFGCVHFSGSYEHHSGQGRGKIRPPIARLSYTCGFGSLSQSFF